MIPSHDSDLAGMLSFDSPARQALADDELIPGHGAHASRVLFRERRAQSALRHQPKPCAAGLIFPQCAPDRLRTVSAAGQGGDGGEPEELAPHPAKK
jgi:hypothetical protein